MKLPIEIEKNSKTLFQLCKKYKVSKLFLFGSILKDSFNPKTSDIDFIVEIENIPPIEKGENLMSFWTELELLFSRKIDLLSSKKIKNPYLLKEINKTKSLIYDGTI
ncbi:MAG: nucleotidyltransferase domain-containing protein [Flavobacteriaceae bacterium]|nr:nucleotidyltransferase domain-containing protein [Flavobacteriaceae bacterium]